MCAILDTNLAGEVFKPAPDPVPRQFFSWMNSLQCRLVVGGELRRELERVEAYLLWSQQALRSGRLQQIDDDLVDARTAAIEDACRSNDAHVIALAQLSGARVLYSKDNDLRGDFRDRELLIPPGSLLPLGETRNARQRRAALLSQPDLCPLRRMRP